MNFKLEQEFSKTDIIKQVDDLKSQIDAMRPLPPDVEGRVMQKLRLDWNYHSNAIEGNRLSYGETVALLMHGITAKGKPMKDHLDIQGHNEAIDYLLAIVNDGRAITEADIRSLHTIILVEPYRSRTESSSKQVTLGEYKKMPNHVKTITDEIHYYATPEETPAKMNDLMEWYNTAILQKDIHPLVIAALFHHKFVAIHPFDDGNGRLARILMNMILMQHHFPPVVIKSDKDDRHAYYALLSQADVGENWPFVEAIAELMVHSLNIYLKAAHGGDIDEEDDIDKDIALFRMQIKDHVTVKKIKSFDVVKECINNEINPFLIKLFKTAKLFNDDFISAGQFITVRFNRNDLTVNSVELITDILFEKIFKNFNIWNGVEFYIQFHGFKNHINNFNLSLMGYVEYEYYEYKIYNGDQKLLVSKLYHEKLTSEDHRTLVKSFVDNIKNQIQENINLKS